MSDSPPPTTATPTGGDHDPTGGGDRPVAPTEAALLAEREGVAIVGRSFGRQTWDRFRRHRLAIFATVFLALLALSFWIGPVFSSWDPLTPDTSAFRQGPSREHPFGTDPIGRDLMVRTFVGGRFSLRIALFVALLTTAIGTVLGATAGYIGGIVDTLIDQLTNLFLLIPALVVLLVVANRFGSSPNSIAFLLAILLWPTIARVVRGLFLQYKEQEFVLAAKAAGARAPRIMFRHILPNTFGPIVVNATLLIGTAIILESTLSFLGVGVQAPTPTLGNLIFESKGYIESKPSAVFIPGGFIVAITLCVNFLGDGLRDALDPTTRRS
ncbi:MAG: ABC transporter permease [Nitriliruptor sp.]|uniref:ABC transporter permease n=1 Tax=Nitriliruptor sp. TaxID=2448056 RepID=UPI0034A05687